MYRYILAYTLLKIGTFLSYFVLTEAINVGNRCIDIVFFSRMKQAHNN